MRKKLICSFAIFALLLTLTSALSVHAALTDNQFLHYRFDEGSGTVLVDDLGLHNGTLRNMNRVAGYDGSAVAGNGGTYTTFTSSNAQFTPSASTPYTAAAWVKMNQNTAVNDIITVGPVSTNAIIWELTAGVRSGSVGYFSFSLNKAFAGWCGKAISPTPYNVGQWYFVAGVYDGSTLKLYIDGTLVNTTLYTGCAPTSVASVINIGTEAAGGGDAIINGAIDEVQVWSRALSATEIAQVYNFKTTNNFSISVNDTRTGTLISGFSWNYTTTNASDNNQKSGYCNTTSCSITNFTGTLTITVLNVSGGTYFNPYDSPNTYSYNGGTNTSATFNTYKNSLNLNLTNTVNGSSIGNFCVQVSNSSYSQSNCTNSGTLSFYNVSGNTALLYFNISGNTYFNVSHNIGVFNSTNVNYTNSTYQAILNISAIQRYTNSIITSFNSTNGFSTNTTVGTSYDLLPANNGTNNVLVSPAGNFTQNISCTVPSPLQTISCNATGIYDGIYSFNVSDRYNNAAILNFTIIATNPSIIPSPLAISTTNGSVNVSLLQGYSYSFNLSTSYYENKIISLQSNASIQFYQFNVLPAPSINISIYDANTNAPILQNTTITIINSTGGSITYTTTGGYFLLNVAPSSYTIQIGNANYSQSVYTITPTQGIVYLLNAYLQQGASTFTLQFVDATVSTASLSSVTVTQSRLINGSFLPTDIRQSDVTGNVVFNYLPNTAYQFTANLSSYQTRQFTLNPVISSSYTIKLVKDATASASPDYQGVLIDFTPKLFISNQTNIITFTFYSPSKSFQSYGYSITYPGGTVSDAGTNPSGTTYVTQFNITGATSFDHVNVSFSYDIGFGQRNFSQTYGIVVPSTNTFESNRVNTFGMGLFERALVGTLVILIVMGFFSLLNPIAALAVGLFIMGLFIKMGFWEWWLAGISFLIGIIIIMRRTE